MEELQQLANGVEKVENETDSDFSETSMANWNGDFSDSDRSTDGEDVVPATMMNPSQFEVQSGGGGATLEMKAVGNGRVSGGFEKQKEVLETGMGFGGATNGSGCADDRIEEDRSEESLEFPPGWGPRDNLCEPLGTVRQTPELGPVQNVEEMSEVSTQFSPGWGSVERPNCLDTIQPTTTFTSPGVNQEYEEETGRPNATTEAMSTKKSKQGDESERKNVC